MTWLPLIRLSRLDHNHIFQGEYEDCPACADIDPWHQTELYVNWIFGR